MATPVHQHAEVEACLKDILNAVKGEEVRGSIYDAIQLIDQRSIALENEIRDSVEDIADEAVAKVINSFDLIYTFDSYGGITCNRTFTDIGDIMFSAGGKSPTYYIIAPNENTPKAAIGETVLAMVTPGDEFYESYIYTITETGLYSNITTINEYHIKHYQDRITFTDKTFQVQPKLTPGNNITIDETDPEHPVINSTGGGGGSYTEGDGIDITNDEISVKLRSSNPGLAFDSNGNLYATGSGGSYSGSECISVYNNVISLLYGDGLTVEYDSLNDIYELVPDYTYVQQKLDAGYGIAIRPGTGASTNPEISVLPGVFMPYYDINQGSGLIIVSNANDSTSLEVDFTTVQSKLTAGTGISIQNGVISLDLPQAEGGGF